MADVKEDIEKIQPVETMPTISEIVRTIKRAEKRNTALGVSKVAFTKTDTLSIFTDPYSVASGSYGDLKTIERELNRGITARTLRRVASKAWLINVCKLNVIRHIEPFLKPSTAKNIRGFIIRKKGELDVSLEKSEKEKQIEEFILKTGIGDDDEREDNLNRYCVKILNDLFDLDQIATEIRYSRNGKAFDFWAVDAGTIERVLPGQDNPAGIKYVQVLDHIPYAFYNREELIFDYQNGQTDIRLAYYGQSYVEKSIDLITAYINMFLYNAGYFTENKLPRGMLLIDGDASQETVEAMEDYIYDIMSGNPTSQWRIPIIPSGMKKSEGGNAIKWVSLSGTNREMEFQQWNDYLTSAICALWGTSIDEIGLQTSKAQPLFDNNAVGRVKENKNRILSSVLNFLQQYLNKIIEKFEPDYELEFIGYERENPKEVLDIDKEEVSSYKTLNEKRIEKGMEPLEGDWANIPMNPYAVQLYQSAQGGMGGGMGDFGDFGDFGGEEEEGQEGEPKAEPEAGEEQLWGLGETGNPTPEEIQEVAEKSLVREISIRV